MKIGGRRGVVPDSAGCPVVRRVKPREPKGKRRQLIPAVCSDSWDA